MRILELQLRHSTFDGDVLPHIELNEKRMIPDLIRHGRGTTFTLVVANYNTHGASVRMILKDLEGEEVDRSEQLLLPGSQRSFTLGDLFDRTRFAGSVTLVSDIGVGISARQSIVNVRGDEILT